MENLLRTFCRNVIGNAAGMYLFREYLRGTCGARVISCWMHVQPFRKTQDLERRVELFSAIRRYYLHPVITLPGPGCLSDIVAAGENGRAARVHEQLSAVELNIIIIIIIIIILIIIIIKRISGAPIYRKTF